MMVDTQFYLEISSVFTIAILFKINDDTKKKL